MVKKISARRLEEAREWLFREPKNLKTIAKTITPSLKKAAAAFGLDPKDPHDAAILLRILAQLVFSDGKRGRPPNTSKWIHPREYDLGYHFHLLRQEKPRIKLTAAAKAIKLRWPKEYADSSETTLRQRMRAAYQCFEAIQAMAEEHAQEETL
jgi:hypothetical protein